MTDIRSRIEDDVDDYLERCRRAGEEPQYTKTFQGCEVPDCYGEHAKELEWRDRRKALYQEPVEKWPKEDLIRILEEAYKPSVIPPCRICGQPLTVSRIGGGEPTVWACDGMEEDPENKGILKYKEGRSCADEHYAQSKYIDPRQGGDPRVIELIRRIRESKNT